MVVATIIFAVSVLSNFGGTVNTAQIKNDQDQKSISSSTVNEISYVLPVRNTKTKSTSDVKFSFRVDLLRKNDITDEQMRKAWVEKSSERLMNLVVKGMKIPINPMPVSLAIFNSIGKFSVNLNMTRFLSASMKDIEGDTSLLPLPPKKLEWKLPSRCSLSSLSLYVNSSSITLGINEEEIRYNKENNISHAGKEEGLLLSVLNPWTCKITLDNLAFTSDIGGYRDLLWGLESIQPGKLILLASLGDGAAFFNTEARNAITTQGLLWAPFYLYRDSWISIFVKGGRTLHESLCPNVGMSNTSASPVNVTFDIEELLVQEPEDCSSWPTSMRWKARRIFCELHDGYHSLCNCKNPFEFPDRLNATDRIKLPVLIMVGNRTRHLYRLLESLGRQQNITKETLLLVSDGHLVGVTRLAFILNLKILIHKPEGTGIVRISRNLRFGLYNGLKYFPMAEAFVILEEDLLLSPDFYKYMMQLEPIFKIDKTVFCVSAFNHLSYPHTSRDPTLTYRVQSYPAYGWMMSTDILKEIIPKWLPEDVNFEWDFFLGSDIVRRKRECIIPDINRSYHWSTKGVHANSLYTSEILYLSRNVNEDPNAHLQPLERLKKKNYEEEFRNLLASSIAVNFTQKSDLDETVSPGQVFAIYVLQWRANDNAAFQLCAQELGIWWYDLRDHHNSAWRFFYRNATILIIGVPFSPYRKFMPPGHFVLRGDIDVPKSFSEMENLAKSSNIIQTHNQSNFLIPFNFEDS